MEDKIYPKNKAHFKRLVQFGKEIIHVCKKHRATPVFYGSVAHFMLTQDKSMKVNDLDFYVPGDKVSGIYRELKRKGAKEFDWIVGKTHTPDVMKAAKRTKGLLIVKFPDSESMIAVNGDLRVELDDNKDFIKEFGRNPNLLVPLDFAGEKIKMVSLSTMGKIYKSAYAREKGKDKEKIRRKMSKFEAYIRKC